MAVGLAMVDEALKQKVTCWCLGAKCWEVFAMESRCYSHDYWQYFSLSDGIIA